MATNKELEKLVQDLAESVNSLQVSNSNLRDDVVLLQHNYSKLVKEVSTRLEAIHGRFQSN